MAVQETNLVASLSSNLKVLEDSWLPPRTWESIPSESGQQLPSSSSNQPIYNASTLSESSMVRLAMNAMQGNQSALVSVENLIPIFISTPADRTFHRIPNLWNRASSTHALGNILKSIGSFGSLVFLVRRFVDHFTSSSVHGVEESENEKPPYSLVNQAFAVAVGKVLKGYMCALDTVYTSIGLRRGLKGAEGADLSVNTFSDFGCMKSVVHSEITLIEFYLHTKELRIHIEALGNICNLYNLSREFLESSFDDLIDKAACEFQKFYRGANVLTYLYIQLEVADPGQRSMLKFLLLRAIEPYYGFIKSWIFKAEINDPYNEFFVEKVDYLASSLNGKGSIPVHFPLAKVREHEEVAIPCFLKNFLIPLVRAGQQLQVLMRLLELCIHDPNQSGGYEDLLPCWSGSPSNVPSCSSSLTFSHDSIESLVLSRDTYYKKMNEKLDCSLTSLKIRYQEATLHGSVSLSDTGMSLDALDSFLAEDYLAVYSKEDRRSPKLRIDDVESDNSSMADEFLYVEEVNDSSECSSSKSAEEQLESDQIVLPYKMDHKERYLSALSFSQSTPLRSSTEDAHQSRIAFLGISDSQETCHRSGVNHHIESHHEVLISNHIMAPDESEKAICPFIWSSHSQETLPDKLCQSDHVLKNPFYVEQRHIGESELENGPSPIDMHMGPLRDTFPCYKHETTNGILAAHASYKNQNLSSMSVSPKFYTQPSNFGDWNNVHGINPLSLNPMLRRNAFPQLVSRTIEKHTMHHGKSLPFFDFTEIHDPCQLSITSEYEYESAISPSKEPNYSTTARKSLCHDDRRDDYEDDTLVNVSDLSCIDMPPLHKNQSQDVLMSPSGGSSWERLLGYSSYNCNYAITSRQSLLAKFETPLDFIIDKCLLQEIMLQYNYVSKLTIKLLEEAFDLQEHLVSLRRFHFMEMADWADIFILSLWKHKWYVTPEQRLSEIQGFLELSVQRSSCEWDPNKARLFVYIREHRTLAVSTSAIGVHSFEFLALGYRVDWPVSIVLTPSALKIYSDIFSFLMQVKLSVFSLTDIWCTLKMITKKSSCKEQHVLANLHSLMKIRHQLNHFVCTLQQYVESQLSQISWCRFLHSLQHKVKDMMDLESIHMQYLTNSLQICFLSDEAQAVARIIKSILQCAIDLRYCLTTSNTWDVQKCDKNFTESFSRIKMSQVNSIQQKFDKNRKDLHLCYLRGSKHGEFGISRFWESLNYNEYYSDLSNGMEYLA